MLESRIKELLKIVTQKTVDEIENLFKDEEVKYLKNHLEKYPEVKYSEKLLKKMFREARNKKISAGRKGYLKELIDCSSKFRNADYFDEVLKETKFFVDELSTRNINIKEVKVIHIEHDHAANDFYCQLYGKDNKRKYDNELDAFQLSFDFTELWKFREASKYSELCEILNFVEIDNEEFMIAFEELIKLRSYKLVKMALNRKSIRDQVKGKLGLRNATIILGEHDNWFFEVFKC